MGSRRPAAALAGRRKPSHLAGSVDLGGNVGRMERWLKIILSAGLAILCGLITFGNIHDPDANLRYVEHVLSMDTIEPGSKLSERAIPIPFIWQFAFWSIVAAEGATAALFTGGTVELWRARMAPARDFHQAKRFVFAGAAAGYLIWFVGFSAVGGEWFAMWKSQTWNGQQAAFRICMFILLCTLIVGQKEGEL